MSPRFLLISGSVTLCTAKSALHTARELNSPAASSTVNGESENSEFWEQHAPLLRQAWKEWELNEAIPNFNLSMIDPELVSAVSAAWKNPSANEDGLRKLFTEISPGVFRFQLFDPSRLHRIRSLIDSIPSSGIPTRRPNGMNRYGCILSPDVDGAVVLEAFNEFNEELTEYFIRPLGRFLFPEYVNINDDIESYAFTVRYREDEDLSLEEHSDASLITLNANINLPEEDFEGSSIYFVHEGEKHNTSFAPGTALLHRGLSRHAALPLRKGTRTNLIFWLFGEYGQVRIAPYSPYERLTPEQRWSRRNGHGDEL